MHTVAVISQKGGAGKTTLAVHLAVEAERSGLATAIIDLGSTSQRHRLGRQRAAYVHCLTAELAAQEFKPEGTAADEIDSLFQWGMQQVWADHEQQETELVGSTV